MTSAPPQILSQNLVQRLETEFGILHLIYHRDHNQHHVATWWKHFNQLHRNVRKILRLTYEFDNEPKHKLKHKLRQEALGIARAMIKKRLFTRCHYSFSGIVALGQFVGLGLTLIASLSAIHSIIVSMDGITQRSVSQTIKTSGNKDVVSRSDTPSSNLDDDIGEEIVFPEKTGIGSVETVATVPLDLHRSSSKLKPDEIISAFDDKPKKRKKEKKPKEKRKKTAIDDIFG
ncbi:hypothetical protein OY671_001269 [Metschnikowia pulcherrima]|nr:hypothetical protein OY671_001269 [Metschnikowia pulcherrima]